MSGINPRVDLVFKKIFGSPENKDLLIALINATVSDADKVSDVTLLNPYNLQSFKEDKLSILDIKATGCNGNHFNIEIQITDEGDYDKRALYYWAKLYSDQLKASGDYSSLSKVIGIHILNFTSISDAEKYHNVFHITEKETGLTYFKDLELHTVELKKFIDSLGKGFENIAEKIQNSLDLWSAFLTKHELLTPDKLVNKLDNPELKKAMEVLRVMNFSDEEREAYENRLKWLRIESSALKKMEGKGFEQGRIEGRAEGLIEGHAKGRAEGHVEGGEEVKMSIALLMLKECLSTAQISKITGLSEKELSALSTKHAHSSSEEVDQ